MNTIRELAQKGKQLKQRIEKFGAPFGNKNAAGPHDGIPGDGKVVPLNPNPHTITIPSVMSHLVLKVYSLRARVAQLEWREEWHPRESRGSLQGKGGQFAPKGSSTMVQIREQIKNWESAKAKLQARIAKALSQPADPVFGRSDVFRYETDITRIDALIKAKREELAIHVTDTAGPAGDVLLRGVKYPPMGKRSRTRVLKEKE